MVEWAALVPASLIVAATPGANQILALRNGVRAGTTTAIIASLGRFAAFILMVIVVAIGLAAVLGTSRIVFEILKWTGVAYLAWLGVRALRDGSRVREPTRKEHPNLRPSRLARQEFLVAMANPKALILFTVFLPQFVLSGTATAPALLAAGMAYIAIEFVCACGYAAIGGHIGVNGLTRRARRTMDRLTGGAMLGLAGWLATEKQA